MIRYLENCRTVQRLCRNWNLFVCWEYLTGNNYRKYVKFVYIFNNSFNSKCGKCSTQRNSHDWEG